MTESDGRLAGRTVLVTGAGSGLGRATADLCAAAGARVALADIDPDAVHEAAVDIGSRGATCTSVLMDVTDLGSVEAAVARAREVIGPMDTLVHSAGIAGDGTVLTVSQADWSRVLDVNLTGAFHAARAVLPGMLESGRGSIVFIASVGGLVGVPAIAPYAAAKGGVIALTRQMALDFAEHGVRVNAICPGTVPTPLVLGSYASKGIVNAEDPTAGLAEAARRRYPLGRLGTPRDVANYALFLAGTESEWITGSVVTVDGGLTSAGWIPGN